MLVGTDDRGVHADRPPEHRGGVGLDQKSSQDVVPGAVSAVAAVPLPQRLPRPELGRDVSPGKPAPIPVDDPLEHPAVIAERAPATPLGGGQQRRQTGPLGIGQDSGARHRSSIAHPGPPIWETRPSSPRPPRMTAAPAGCSQPVGRRVQGQRQRTEYPSTTRGARSALSATETLRQCALGDPVERPHRRPRSTPDVAPRTHAQVPPVLAA